MCMCIASYSLCTICITKSRISIKIIQHINKQTKPEDSSNFLFLIQSFKLSVLYNFHCYQFLKIIPILEGLPTLRKYMTIFKKNFTTCLHCIKEGCDIIGQTERNQSWKDKQGSDDIRYVN